MKRCTPTDYALQTLRAQVKKEKKRLQNKENKGNGKSFDLKISRLKNN